MRHHRTPPHPPAVLATHLVALVIYQQVSGRSPIGLSAALMSPSPLRAPLAIFPAQAALLEQAAEEGNARFGFR